MARIAYAPMRRQPFTREGARRSQARAIAHHPTAADALGGTEPKLVRSKCRRCHARWAVPRVTVDFRDPSRLERVATLECARCSRTFRTCNADAYPVTERVGEAIVQRVRLTLILPATATRWYSRGAWHREGDDARILADATLADADEATRLWRTRADRKAAAAARAKARKAEADAEACARMAAMLATWAAREAEEAAAEAEAAAREAA
jgi:hypothetical protein